MTRLRPEHRRRERAVARTLWIDAFCIAYLLVFAASTGSLTLIAEGARSVLMYGLLAYVFTVLRSIHRGRLSHLEFGVSKLEHFAAVLFALGLLVSAAWLFRVTVDTLLAERAASGSLDLAVAALVNAVNLVFNLFMLAIVRRQSGHDPSEAYRVQIRARLVMVGSNVILQVTLTLAALAGDPVIAALFDALGAGLVTLLILRSALSMLGASVPLLLDARAPAAVHGVIRSTVLRRLPRDVTRLRTRRDGDATVAELVLRRDAETSPLACAAPLRDIEDDLAQAELAVRLSVSPEDAPAAATGA